MAGRPTTPTWRDRSTRKSRPSASILPPCCRRSASKRSRRPLKAATAGGARAIAHRLLAPAAIRKLARRVLADKVLRSLQADLFVEQQTARLQGLRASGSDPHRHRPGLKFANRPRLSDVRCGGWRSELMRSLTAREESWPIAGAFVISRGGQDRGQEGRGGRDTRRTSDGARRMHPLWPSYGEAIAGVLGQIAEASARIEAGADRAALQGRRCRPAPRAMGWIARHGIWRPNAPDALPMLWPD